MEVWKGAVGYEGIYEVSNTGKVRTHINKTTFSKRFGVDRKWKQRVLKQKVSKDNNCRVNLWLNGKDKTWLVHRIVALSFIPKEKGRDYVNHIDGNRLNNSVENLEWCNHTENSNHAFDTGLVQTCHKIALYDTETKKTHNFRSKTKASEFLGKHHSYVSTMLKQGKTRYTKYIILEKKAN